jgi:hypothetical protein
MTSEVKYIPTALPLNDTIYTEQIIQFDVEILVNICLITSGKLTGLADVVLAYFLFLCRTGPEFG